MACPNKRYLYLLREDGTHSANYLDCHTWRCESCAREKLEMVAQALALQAPETVWVGSCGKRHTSAARQQLKVGSKASVRLTRVSGGLWWAADMEVRGRGWSSEEMRIGEVVLAVVRLDVVDNQIKRGNWAGEWKGLSMSGSDKAPVIYRKVWDSDKTAYAELKDIDIDVRKDRVDDVEVALIELQWAYGPA